MFRWGLGQLTTFRGENNSNSQERRTEDALQGQGLEGVCHLDYVGASQRLQLNKYIQKN